MNSVGEKYLPIGTVVILKEASKRLMITGFCSMDAENKDVMYDYSGCLYPEGVISSNQTALFNHDQIEKVFHLGLVDEEEKDFKEKLSTLLSNVGNEEKVEAQPNIEGQMAAPFSESPTLQMPTYNNQNIDDTINYF